MTAAGYAVAALALILGFLAGWGVARNAARERVGATVAAAVARELESWAESFDMWDALPGRTALRPGAVAASLRMRAAEVMTPWTVSFSMYPAGEPEGVAAEPPTA